MSINQSKINVYVETVSMNCSLTAVSISFPLPVNILEMSQFELENESVFVDKIQLYGYDGVHKSSECSPLEFSQIEIKYTLAWLSNSKSAVSAVTHSLSVTLL